MSTHAFGRRAKRHVGVRLGLSRHWVWLGWGSVLAIAVPFALLAAARSTMEVAS